MTSSSSARDAPVLRSRRSSPEPALPSCSWTRTGLPSDQILSTHTIHPPGLDVLDDVGVGDAVRAVAPPTHIVRLRKNDAFVDIEFPRDRAEYCPRRWRLDGLLQGAAASAGVEVLDQTRVTSLMREGDRVVGVRAAGAAGQEHVIRATLAVGADGRHSTVARLVEAEEYLAYDAPRAMFWGYWNAPGFWRTDPAYPFGMYIANTDGHIRVIFQTDHDQLLIGSLPPVEQAMAWRTHLDAALIADLASDSTTGPLIAGSAPDGPIRGTVKERYFFRRAAGNGWALVGDAGHHKEFVIGDGITEALLQARGLASAIARGTDAALHRWWHARDVEALPFFFLGQDEGALGPPMELQQVVFSHVAKSPALRARMAATMEHQLSPLETFPVRRVLGWTLDAAFRGSLGVVTQFLARGRRGSAINRELRLRRRLLAEAEAAEAQAIPPDMSPGSGVLPRAADFRRARTQRRVG